MPEPQQAVLREPMVVLAVLLGFLALLFAASRHSRIGRLFRVVPLLVFAYFVPTALSNSGVIPAQEDFVLYQFIKDWLLPSSLVLLILAVDVPAILGLGFHAVLLFFIATATVIAGGPLAYALLGGLVPPEINEQVWKGLAALCGSWIGGGANFVAIGEGLGASDTILSLMVVVDVAVANVWMAVLLAFAGREKQMDAKLGADRRSIDALRAKVEAFQASVSRPANLPDLLLMLAIAFGATALARAVAPQLPQTTIIGGFTWIVVITSTIALALSFTRLRRLEGAGASQVGSVFLYLLVASIGAKADFREILDPAKTGVLVIGVAWMAFHAFLLLLARRLLRAPVFFAAVASQANIGGAASAPIVASAFHPALAPVGVLLAIGGYVMGVYGGLACAWLLELVYQWRYAAGA